MEKTHLGGRVMSVLPSCWPWTFTYHNNQLGNAIHDYMYICVYYWGQLSEQEGTIH